MLAADLIQIFWQPGGPSCDGPWKINGFSASPFWEELKYPPLWSENFGVLANQWRQVKLGDINPCGKQNTYEHPKDASLLSLLNYDSGQPSGPHIFPCQKKTISTSKRSPSCNCNSSGAVFVLDGIFPSCFLMWQFELIRTSSSTYYPWNFTRWTVDHKDCGILKCTLPNDVPISLVDCHLCHRFSFMDHLPTSTSVKIPDLHSPICHLLHPWRRHLFTGSAEQGAFWELLDP